MNDDCARKQKARKIPCTPKPSNSNWKRCAAFFFLLLFYQMCERPHTSQFPIPTHQTKSPWGWSHIAAVYKQIILFSTMQLQRRPLFRGKLSKLGSGAIFWDFLLVVASAGIDRHQPNTLSMKKKKKKEIISATINLIYYVLIYVYTILSSFNRNPCKSIFMDVVENSWNGKPATTTENKWEIETKKSIGSDFFWNGFEANKILSRVLYGFSFFWLARFLCSRLYVYCTMYAYVCICQAFRFMARDFFPISRGELEQLHARNRKKVAARMYNFWSESISNGVMVQFKIHPISIGTVFCFCFLCVFVVSLCVRWGSDTKAIWFSICVDTLRYIRPDLAYARMPLSSPASSPTHATSTHRFTLKDRKLVMSFFGFRIECLCTCMCFLRQPIENWWAPAALWRNVNHLCEIGCVPGCGRVRDVRIGKVRTNAHSHSRINFRCFCRGWLGK